MVYKSSTKGVFIIAEVGSVHDGSFGNACKLIELAAECGADAVKFQTHLAEHETLPDAPMPDYFKGEPRFEYFKRTSFSIDQWLALKEYSDKFSIEFMSSPFSIEAVKLLNKISMQTFKIPSGEVTNLEMLEEIAKTGKHIMLSSGMNSWSELEDAVKVIKNYHNNFIVMQCSSSYPCHNRNVGLNILSEIKERFGVEPGYSDHTLENYAAFSAVTMGAKVIEKHFTFSKYMYGSDAKHSADPMQFKELVTGIRAIEEMINHPVNKGSNESYKKMKEIFEKSLVSKRDISAGEVISKEDICLKKPGHGLPSKSINKVIGATAKNDIKKDTLLLLEMLHRDN